MGGQRHTPATLPPFYRRPVAPQERPWRVRETFFKQGFEPKTVHSVQQLHQLHYPCPRNIPNLICSWIRALEFFYISLCCHLQYTGCFKKSFTTLKAYRNLYTGHTQRFELSKCSKTHRVLPRIVIRNCYAIPFMHVVLQYPIPPPRALPHLKSRWLLSQVQSVLVVCFGSMEVTLNHNYPR